MKIALAQINTTIGDFEGNKTLILDAYRKAVAQGAELVLTPELAICGYPPRDLVYRSGFVSGNKETLEAIAQEVGETTLITGFVDFNTKGRGRPFRNAAAVLQRGQIVQVIYKTLLPTYDVFDEDRYFEPAESCLPVFINGTRLGVTVCEDIWTDDYLPEPRYGVNPPRKLAELGIDLLVNISASPFHLGKPAVRERMISEVARELNAPVIYCNAVGGNDQLVFDGNSLAVDAAGGIITRMKPFAEDLAIVDVDVEPDFPHESARPLHLPPKDVKALKAQLKEVLKDDPAPSGRPPAQDLHDALVLGLRDYVHKCGFKSCVLGLSGGIDSALVAALAAEALGPENVLGVSLPSVFSSEGSKDDARDLAKNLGIRYETVPIQEAVEGVKAQLGALFVGRAEDITEENMQARMRGLILMSISNKFGHLLLTTGNKSELAVGYCTIYGDMCGGLAVISDLPKTQVYAVSRWINRNQEIIPWASIEKPPSAELKPDQKDQDTLPEYDVLDAILEMFLERGMNAREIAAAGHDEELVRWVLRRIDANEWKRQQAAPGLKVTTKAFGIGRRIPIVQRFKS
jgi:NAD+ synthase (glutamine-hydrolysing)